MEGFRTHNDGKYKTNKKGVGEIVNSRIEDNREVDKHTKVIKMGWNNFLVNLNGATVLKQSQKHTAVHPKKSKERHKKDEKRKKERTKKLII